MQSTEITTVLCYLAVLGKSFLTISNHKKTLAQNENYDQQSQALAILSLIC